MLGLERLQRWFRGPRDSAAAPAQPPVSIRFSALTHPGRVRAANEDSVLYTRPGDRQCALALVADGMGGARGGGVASEMAVRLVSQRYLADSGDPVRALRKALETANKEIYCRSRREPALAGMGTTCVALALNPPRAWAAWVGDSRIYLIRRHQIFQMTEDHSVVREMVRNGLLTREEASQHDERNLVTRALGSHRSVKVATWEQAYPVREGDRFLLCSDGLHDLLADATMLDIAGSGDLEIAGARLIEEANRRGGHDNISAVLVEIAPGGDSAVRATRDYVPASEVTP